MSAPTIDTFVDITISVSDALADRTSFGTPLGVFDHSATANRVDGPYTTIDEVTAAGFTAVAEPEVYGWASAAFAQELGVDQIKIGRQDAGDSDWTDTLTQVDAEDDDWYLLNIESRAEADILLAAAYIEARSDPAIYIAQSSDAALLDGTAGNVGEDLQAQDYHRTALIHHEIDDSTGGSDESDGYLDGAWTSRCGGFKLDQPDGVGRWSYKQVSGIPYNTFTSAQQSNLETVNANWYGRTKGLSFTFPGVMASGRFIDVTTSVDWLKARLQEALITAFVAHPTGIGFDTDGIGKIRRAAGTVLANGLAYGHLSRDFAQKINWPKATEVSSADRTARSYTGTGTLVLRGGINTVALSLTVTP